MKRILLYILSTNVLILCALPGTSQLPIEHSFVFEEASFPQCHASTLVATPEGIIVAWFGGTHEKHEDVGIWYSRQENGGWSEPHEVANGIQHEDKRYPCWNPVLYLRENQELFLFYKVGPSPREWWGEYITSSDFGKTWSKPRRLPEDILGPVKNKPIARSDGKLLCGSSTEHDGWRVHVEIHDPKLDRWKKIDLHSDSVLQVIQPTLIRHDDGRIQMLCRSKNNVIVEAWSTDEGDTWSRLEPVELPNPNSGIDAATGTDGAHWLIYNPTIVPEGEWGGSRWPLTLARSEDGKEWHKVIDLEIEPGEYSYPAIIATDDGSLHMSYTWKRERIKYVRIDPSH